MNIIPSLYFLICMKRSTLVVSHQMCHFGGVSRVTKVFSYFYLKNVNTYGTCTFEFISLHSWRSYTLLTPTKKLPVSLLKIFEFLTPKVEVRIGKWEKSEERDIERECGRAHKMETADMQITWVAFCRLCYVLTCNREVIETSV